MTVRSVISAACAVAVAASIVLPARQALSAGEDHGYVGSRGCGMCHKEVKPLWDTHGHSRMLRKVEGGAPEGASVTLPEGMTWADVSYLIGGDLYYARFANSQGYVVTGPGTQWSMRGEALTPFKADIENGTLKYSCVKCHTTGWMESGSYEKGVANDLPGIPGVWHENSVGCETCHGPGHEHILVKNKRDLKKKDKKADLKIIVGKSSEMCGECHKRNDEKKMINVVSPELTQSRQQYSELMASKKALMRVRCVDCHDPHSSSRGEAGFVRACEDCHKGKFAMPVKIAAMQDLECTECHMPRSARGAFDEMVGEYHLGDTVNHIFGITDDPNYKLDDGTGHATINSDGFARLTVEMTCYACHQSGEASTKSRAELLDHMKEVHEN